MNEGSTNPQQALAYTLFGVGLGALLYHLSLCRETKIDDRREQLAGYEVSTYFREEGL
jgi:hypothetical protein